MRMVLLAITLGAAACKAPPSPEIVARPRPGPVAASAVALSREEAGAAYRRDRTFAALERVVARLEPGLPRAEVERLLGEPDGWDDPSIFYRGDRVNRARESLGLTLDFYLWYTDGRRSTRSDRLERWTFGPGSRFEEGDATLRELELPPSAEAAEVTQPAALFRQRHEYESLRRVVAWLRLGLPRAEVEKLLGAPHDCGPEGLPCHYRSERRNTAGVPLGLTVEYRVHNAFGTKTVVTDRLEAMAFGPVLP